MRKLTACTRMHGWLMGLLERMVLTPMEFLSPTPSYPLMSHIMLVKASEHSLLLIFPYSVDGKTPYLALGAVKNISLNISISNLGDDAYDANLSFNVSRELFFINMWQKVRKAPLKESLCSIWSIFWLSS